MSWWEGLLICIPLGIVAFVLLVSLFDLVAGLLSKGGRWSLAAGLFGLGYVIGLAMVVWLAFLVWQQSKVAVIAIPVCVLVGWLVKLQLDRREHRSKGREAPDIEQPG
ncbi:MAG: hypothetical protein NTU41_01460 [Chloroflexi bacterium]|nr:hypothetical protein [Chloroflexota bacterium]